jgi:hypothetical protein
MTDLDLETRLRTTLADRAAHTSTITGLGERAAHRGRRIRRFRILVGTAAAAIIAVTSFAVYPRTPEATTLPAETAAPPGGIGRDRALLHFDIDLTKLPSELTARITSTEWVSGDGYEHVLALDAQDKTVLSVAMSTDPTRLDGWVKTENVGETRALRWHRGDVEAVSAVDWADQDLLPQVAQAVRLDRVQRCVMPLRLSELPEGAHWLECQTRIRRGPGPGPVWQFSGLTIQRADGRIVLIWADGREKNEPGGGQILGARTSSFFPDRTTAGHPAKWRAENGQFQHGLWIPDFGGFELYVTEYESTKVNWFTPDEATWYAEHLTPSRNLNDPTTWPRRTVG